MKREEREMFKNVVTTGQLTAIEPLIDELIRRARETADIETIALPFHAVVQLAAFLKFHEWREPRPGYHDCPECHAEFQGTLPDKRFHRRECRVGELLKFLQATLKTSKGSKHHAVSEHTPSTAR